MPRRLRAREPSSRVANVLVNGGLAQPKIMAAVLARPFHLKLGVNELKHNAHCQRQECSDARGS